MRSRRFLAGTLGLVCSVALITAVPVTAQTDVTTGRIDGQVVDRDGQPLPGVSVTAAFETLRRIT